MRLIRAGNMGFFRLNCIPRPPDAINLWNISNLLLRKFTAPEFTATTKLTFNARFDGEEIGLVVMGINYATISLKRDNSKLQIQTAVCKDADKAVKEEITETIPADSTTIYFRVLVQKNAECHFSYSIDGRSFQPIGKTFKAREGKWIGAKIGFFALRNGVINDAGSADIDWFRITKPTEIK